MEQNKTGRAYKAKLEKILDKKTELNLVEEAVKLEIKEESNPYKQAGNIKVLDSIYQSTEKKIDRIVKQRRLMSLQGKNQKKTLVEERMDMIEEKVYQMQNDDADFLKLTNVTDVTNKGSLIDPRLVNNEKLKGRFTLIINKDLPMKKQIEKFANEPVAYYLHKNRNFIEKLESRKAKQSSEQVVQKITENLHNIAQKGKWDLYCLMNNIDPAHTILQPENPEFQNFNAAQFLRQQKLRKLERARKKTVEPYTSSPTSLNIQIYTLPDADGSRKVGSFIEGQDLNKNRNETEMGLSHLAAEEIDIKNRMLVTPSQHRESFNQSNTSKHNQDLDKNSQINIGTHQRKEALTKNKFFINSDKQAKRKRNAVVSMQFQIDDMYKSNRSKIYEESLLQLYSPSQIRTPHNYRQKKKFEDPKKEQYRYNMLYNKVNLNLRNEMNKLKTSRHHLSPHEATSRHLVKQAKILLNEPSMSVINGDSNQLPPIQFQTKPEKTQRDQPQPGSGVDVKQRNKATYVTGKDEMMVKIKQLISECKRQDIDGKNSVLQLEALINEAHIRQDGFQSVFNTLQSLEATEAHILQTLFFYKINDMEEFERETSEIVKTYKYKALS